MINRQSPAFPSLTVPQYTLIVIKTCLKEISCPVWEWKERGPLSYVTVFLLDSKLACHIPISVFLTFLSIMQLTAHKYPNEIFDIETQS